MKPLGILNFLASTSMLPCWDAHTAEQVTKAILQQKGTFTKADAAAFETLDYKVRVTQLSFKGPPRWRKTGNAHSTIVTWPPKPIHSIERDFQAEENRSRWLICPKCLKGQETAGLALLNSSGDKNGAFEFVYCKQCKVQSKSGSWICTCGCKWHTCDMHSLPHLHGAKRVRRKPEEIRAQKVARVSREDDMPLPSILARPTRKRTAPMDYAAASSSSGLETSTVTCGTRKRLKLPPGLAAKFPHIAEDTQLADVS